MSGNATISHDRRDPRWWAWRKSVRICSRRWAYNRSSAAWFDPEEEKPGRRIRWWSSPTACGDAASERRSDILGQTASAWERRVPGDRGSACRASASRRKTILARWPGLAERTDVFFPLERRPRAGRATMTTSSSAGCTRGAAIGQAAAELNAIETRDRGGAQASLTFRTPRWAAPGRHQLAGRAPGSRCCSPRCCCWCSSCV